VRLASPQQLRATFEEAGVPLSLLGSLQANTASELVGAFAFVKGWLVVVCVCLAS
jgi:hypothetical protein